MAKVLLTTHQQGTEHVSWMHNLARERNQLLAMGYELTEVALGATSTFYSAPQFVAADYDFVVIPLLTARGDVNSTDDFFDCFAGTNMGDLPIFVLGTEGNAGYTSDNVGTETPATAAYKKVKWVSTATSTFPTYSYTYGGSRTVKAGNTVTGYGHLDGDTSELFFWKKHNSGTPAVYSSGLSLSNIGGALQILMQIAINEGAIPSPPKKLVSSWDIDDFPGTVNTIADMEPIYSACQTGNIPLSIGLKTGIAGQGVGNEHWVNVDADVKAYVAARTPDKGGLFYPTNHNHNWEWDGSSTGVTTKTAMDTEYRADNARALDAGIVMGPEDAPISGWEYCIPPLNVMSDLGLQLLSPQVDEASSPGNDIVQAGYGAGVVRAFNGSEYLPGLDSSPWDRNMYTYTHRGMLLMSALFALQVDELTFDYEAGDETQRFAQMMSYWLAAQGVPCATFFHGANTYDGHDGGTKPGTLILQMVAEWGVFLTNVHKFIHPSELKKKVTSRKLVNTGIGIPHMRSTSDADAEFEILAGDNVKVARMFAVNFVQGTFDVEGYHAAIDAGEPYGVKSIVTLPNKSLYDDDPELSYIPYTTEDNATQWDDVLAEMDGDPNIYAYEIMNEPTHLRDEGTWFDHQDAMITKIRAVNPTIPIIISSGDGGFAFTEPVEGTNLLYSVHHYVPYAYSHNGITRELVELTYPGFTAWDSSHDVNRDWYKPQIREHLQFIRDFQLEHNVKIFAGEFSVQSKYEESYGSVEYLRDCVDIYNEWGWDWSYWGHTVLEDLDNDPQFRATGDRLDMLQRKWGQMDYR